MSSKLSSDPGSGRDSNPAPAGQVPTSLRKSAQIPRWQMLSTNLLLAAAILAIYGQTLHFGFINYDDPAYVYANPHVNHGWDWNEIAWGFTHTTEHVWFPVTYLSYMMDSQLYGLNAGGYHFTNVLLHAATTVLLFLLLKRMTNTFWCAAFATAFFALHPMRVESVAWVVERKDVLSGLFFMLTLWAWLNYVDNRPAFENPEAPRRSQWRGPYFLSLIFFTLGLLSKPMLVTMPALFLLLDYWPLKRFPASDPASRNVSYKIWRGLILEKVPFIPLSLGACVVTLLTQKNVVLTAQHTSLFWRIGNVALAYTDYLKHFVYPAGLALVYPFSATPPAVPVVLFCMLLLGAITVFAWILRDKHPYLIVGWLWYMGVFLPVIDSMQATQNSHADRYSYLPHIGLCIMIVWGTAALSKKLRLPRIVPGIAAGTALIALTAEAYVQTSYWQNSITIWTHTLASTSDNYFAENTLGSALANENKPNEAIPHFERSIKFNPNYADARANYGITLANVGRRTEAAQQLQLALQLNPNSADANYNLGGVLVDDGNALAAIPYFERSLQLNPLNTKARYDLGVALATVGKWNSAIAEYQQAFGRPLDLTDAQYITGIAFATHGMNSDASELFERVLETRPDSAEAHYRLGLILAQEGQFDAATGHLHKALALATSQGNGQLADSIREQLGTNSPAVQLPKAP